MTKGVIYYNRGTKCIVRLLVSLYSLRKHYNGPISVVCAGTQEEWFLKRIKELNADAIMMPDEEIGSLVLKASLWRYSPYDLTMYLDADTLIFKPIDEYFDYIDKNDFVTGNFANWITTGGMISSRIRDWSKVVPEMIEPAIKFGAAINTGINGWKKTSTLLPEWEKLTRLGYSGECTTRIVDEIACQLLLPHHKCYIADTKWGESVKFGKFNDETIIVHFHGNKHLGERKQNTVWRTHCNELINIYGMKELNNSYSDKSYKNYLKSLHKNLTIVSAVNKDYLEKFKLNFPKWQQTENIMEYPFVIFAHTSCIGDVKEFLNKYKNVKIVEWSFTVASNMREEMLSCFVFGVAKNIETKYWMKLDCDTEPIKNKLELPEDAFKSTITASSCSYTKVKGDDSNNTKHWLNRLDDWADSLPEFKGTKRTFPDNIQGRVFQHKRIASFCEIEETEWTKKLANMCGDRLPVPSQDTVTWYAANRLGKRITTFRFRDYLSP